jgi:hypothetical protein
MTGIIPWGMNTNDLSLLVVGAGAVQVRVNTTIVNMIHEIEQKKRVISVSNFNDPLFDRFNG